MADDRPLEDPNQQIARLQTELDDLRTMLTVRLNRRATGDVEPTVRSTPKQNTLIMNGQTVNRTDYPDLWAWAQEAGVVITGLFTAGNGTTTFTLPDMRGRVPVGVGTLGADTYTLGAIGGATLKTLTVANMPAHDHNVSLSGTSTSNAGTHDHNGGTGDAGGNHGGHFPTQQFNAAAGGDLGVAAWNGGIGNNAHAHSVGDDGGHTHTVNATVNETSMGSGTAFDARQAYIAINWLVWI